MGMQDILNRTVRVTKRDADRHHRLMDRESNPYRPAPRPVEDKPVSRPKYDPDRSGLGKMGGVATRRVGDHHRAVQMQQAALRRERLMSKPEIDTVSDEEMNEWLRANGLLRR